MSSQVFRLVLNSFAVLWFCTPNIVFAAEVRIGSSEVLLPEIEGFELISRDSPGLHPISSRFAQECDDSQCGTYSGRPSRANVASNSWEALQPLFLVQVLDDELVVRSGEFVGLMQQLKADTKGLRANIAADIAEWQLDANIVSPEGSELVFLGVSAEVSEILYETEKYLAIPVHGEMNYEGEDESIVRYTFDAVVGFILVRDKILLTTVIVPKGDLVCSLLTFEKVVEELVRANMQ